jgi:branched-chain amino acid transport system substrate-binding protein
MDFILFLGGKTMKMRILSIALAAAMLTSGLTGCSKGADKNSEASGAASGASGDVIKIGGLAPLTGAVSVYGNATNNGIKIAVDEINDAGGVLGKKIQYICYDEKGDATEAVNAYNKLVQNDEVVALVGDVTSTPTLAVAQQAIQDGLPMITATGTAEAITQTGDNIFRACFTDPFQGELMANYASKKLNAKTAAIIYNMADDYSLGLMETFEKTAKELGLKIVAKESYTTNDVDFKSQLTKIAAQKPDVFFVPVYAQDLALIAVQAQQIGIKAKMLGADGWDGVLEKIDKSNVSALDGSFFSSQYSAESDDPALKKFLSTYKERNKTEANMFSVLGYDAMKMMAQAITEAGSTDSQAIVEKLAAIDYNGLTGNIKFDKDRNPIKQAAITTIQGGKNKFVEFYQK